MTPELTALVEKLEFQAALHHFHIDEEAAAAIRALAAELEGVKRERIALLKECRSMRATLADKQEPG